MKAQADKHWSERKFNVGDRFFFFAFTTIQTILTCCSSRSSQFEAGTHDLRAMPSFVVNWVCCLQTCSTTTLQDPSSIPCLLPEKEDGAQYLSKSDTTPIIWGGVPPSWAWISAGSPLGEEKHSCHDKGNATWRSYVGSSVQPSSMFPYFMPWGHGHSHGRGNDRIGYALMHEKSHFETIKQQS